MFRLKIKGVEKVYMTDKITKIMTKNPVTLKAPATRTDALKLMVKKNVTGIPVVDEEEQYIGILSRRDIFENPGEEQVALVLRKDAPKLLSTGTIQDAVSIMLKSNRRHLAVVNDKNKVVGIVTPHDFLKLIIEQNFNTAVEKFVHSPCIPVHKNVPLKVVFKTIYLTKINAFPVVDDDGVLIGIVSDRDIINNAKVEVSSAVSQLGLGEDEDAWTWEGIRNILKILYIEEKLEIPKMPVEEVMIKNPIYVHNKTSVSKVAKIMIDKNFSQIPVKNAYDELIAMIYDMDLIHSLLPIHHRQK